MYDKDDTHTPRIRFHGDLYTLAPKGPASTTPPWREQVGVGRARRIHRKIQEQGPTPELRAEFREVAAEYARRNLVRLQEDGSTSPFPEEIHDLTPRDFSALAASVKYATGGCWPGPTALVRRRGGVLEVQ